METITTKTFNEMYWESFSVQELRTIAFGNGYLEHYKKDALKELIRRTTEYKVNDLSGGLN